MRSSKKHNGKDSQTLAKHEASPLLSAMGGGGPKLDTSAVDSDVVSPVSLWLQLLLASAHT